MTYRGVAASVTAGGEGVWWGREGGGVEPGAEG